MTLSKADIEHVMATLGFSLQSSSVFGDQYVMTLSTGWKVLAYAAKQANVVEDTAKADSFDEVSFTLDSKGTRHKCTSLKGLTGNAKHILDEMLRVSKDDDLLRCPKCKVRYVHVKEPTAGQRCYSRSGALTAEVTPIKLL